MGFCLAVEAFKFTGLPADRAGWRVSRLALGTTPSWHKLACYLLAIAVAAATEGIHAATGPSPAS